jgi:hypothetical protein
VETDVSEEGKKKQRKMVRENYVWRSQKGNSRSMKRSLE